MQVLRRRYEYIRIRLIDKALHYIFENLVYCDEKTVQTVLALYERFQFLELRRMARHEGVLHW